jgi:hypothetical protein
VTVRKPTTVALRFALLLTCYLGLGALTYFLVAFRSRSAPTVYRENPGPVQLILAILAGALLISTASVIWRVVRRSSRFGVAGMTAAALVALAAVAGMLSVGPFIVSIAAVLALLALPLPSRGSTPWTSWTPPGWHVDPGDHRARGS